MKKIFAILMCLVIMVPVMMAVASTVAASNVTVQGGISGDGTVVGRETTTSPSTSTTAADSNSTDADGSIWDFFVKLLSNANWGQIIQILIASISTIFKVLGAPVGALAA